MAADRYLVRNGRVSWNGRFTERTWVLTQRMDSALVTFDIMLPYYGDVSLMQAAVRSVMAQSDPDWRLTVVDDGQEPGVPEWFAQIADDRVRYQRNEHNLGVSRNYRKCVGLAEAEYMVMMGTDDIMLPNYLAV